MTPMEPVSDFIDWVSLVTVCDKFDRGPVDCNWPDQFVERAVVPGGLERDGTVRAR